MADTAVARRAELLLAIHNRAAELPAGQQTLDGDLPPDVGRLLDDVEELTRHVEAIAQAAMFAAGAHPDCPSLANMRTALAALPEYVKDVLDEQVMALHAEYNLGERDDELERLRAGLTELAALAEHRSGEWRPDAEPDPWRDGVNAAFADVSHKAQVLLDPEDAARYDREAEEWSGDSDRAFFARTGRCGSCGRKPRACRCNGCECGHGRAVEVMP